MSGMMGIDIARRALQAMQYAMDVTAHNVANASTPGYSRQRVILGTTEPFPAPSFNRPLISAQLGTGVEVKTVQRVRDNYFDGQTWKENCTSGQWQVTDNTLKQLETIFNEPSDSGIQNIMGDFYNAWQQLSKNPESVSIRNNVIQTGKVLVTAFNQADSELTKLQDNINGQVGIQVSELNALAGKLSALNKDILQSVTFGAEPNDLLDQRDLLIDQISKYADVSVAEQETGVVKVFINGTALVDDFSANEIKAVPNPSNNGYCDVQWGFNGSSVPLVSGSLKSLVDSRDTLVPKYESELDTLANSMITEVNSIHEEGCGLDGSSGRDFFTGTSAKDIALSDDMSDPANVAASFDGATGDNVNALRIAQLKNSLVMSGNTDTMDDFYRSLVTSLGVESQSSGNMVANSQQYLDLIEAQRQSVSGVSLDEEATNMIKFQRAYEASARVITVMDQMLQVLLEIGR